jgi:hypothetical protein
MALASRVDSFYSFACKRATSFLFVPSFLFTNPPLLLLPSFHGH